MLIFWILAAFFFVATISLIYMMRIRVVKPIFIILSALLFISALLLAVLPSSNAEEMSAMTVTTINVKPQSTVDGAVSAMSEAGWDRSEYVLETDESFDPSADGSVGGDGSFDTAGYKTSANYVAWLCGGSDAANAALNHIAVATGDSVEDVKNVDNWIAVQSLIPFFYDGNLSYEDGTIVDLGVRTGDAGDIFFLYISPSASTDSSTVDAVAVRGACSNPQKLLPKSSNPADYKQPGDGTETDSGTGTRPKSTVTETVESTPTTVVSNDGTSSVTDPVGSETETVSPEASPPTQDTSDDTDVSGDDTLNEGDSGNPL